MEKLNNTQKNNEKAITLIALVVTIIVLLILAGVTINLALSNNGLIERAKDASKVWNDVEKNEIAMMQQIESSVNTVMAYKDEGGGSGTGGEGSGQGGSGGGVTKNIIIKDSTENPIDIANKATYYGSDVSYNGSTFQLFFVDTTGKYSGGTPGVWLQYKDFVKNYNPSDHLDTTGISNSNSILWQINPDLKRFKTEIENSSCNDSIRRVAYFANPANWTSYVKDEDAANGAYAIGGVSAELYCESLNEARGTTSTVIEAKAFYLTEDEYDTFGYLYKPASSDSSVIVGDYSADQNNDSNLYIQNTTKSGIYCKRNSSERFLSSPSGYTDGYLCGVSSGYDEGTMTFENGYNQASIRPAVFIPYNIEVQLAP